MESFSSVDDRNVKKKKNKNLVMVFSLFLNRDSHKIERKLSLIHLAPVNNGKSVCPKNKLRPLSWSMFMSTEIGTVLFCACKQSWRAFVKAFLS